MMANIIAALWGLVVLGVSFAIMFFAMVLAEVMMGPLALWVNMLALLAMWSLSTVLGVLATKRPRGAQWPAVVVVIVALIFMGSVIYGVIAAELQG